MITKLRYFCYSQKFLEQHYRCSIIYSTLMFIVLNYEQHYNWYDIDEKLELATNPGERLIMDIAYFGVGCILSVLLPKIVLKHCHMVW